MLENVNLSFEEGKVTVLLGNSGCGKSTLAAVLCGLYPENAGYLESGRIVIDGVDMEKLSFRERCRYTVQMFQNPDLQFCMKDLREELYFCMENIRVPREEMAARAESTAEKYGAADLLDKPFAVLSGGEKQRAALVCLLLLDPKILVLDEPFANLDEISTKRYLDVLKKKIAENRTTVIVIDHKASNWLDLADRYVVLGEKGSVLRENISPVDLASEREFFRSAGLLDPFAVPQRKHVAPHGGEDAREAGEAFAANGEHAETTAQTEPGGCGHDDRESVISLTNVTIYHNKKVSVLTDVNLHCRKGEMIAVLGPSGMGKTSLFLTLLSQKKYTGSLRVNGEELNRMKKGEIFNRVGIVFQNPAHQFITTNVQKEVALSLRIRKGLAEEEAEERALPLLEEFDLRPFRQFSPFMLSQGQQRRLGVLTMLAGGQDILLLDEPTYGQDGRTTRAIMDRCQKLSEEEGITVLFSTHDKELAREYADRFWIVEGGSAHEEN